MSTLPQTWHAHRLQIATETAGVALWAWDVETDDIAFDVRACEM